MKLIEQQDKIPKGQDFADFIRALRKDLQENPEAWENPTLESFLEALAAWTEDFEGYYLDQGKTPPQLDWKAMGDMFMAAKMYE